jgi:aldehyde:ferredoxin oxidoreductase
MERCNCIREGYVPLRDDVLPDRFFEETIYSKYGESKLLNQEDFVQRREKLYTTLELTPAGVPTKDLLRKLDIDFVTPTLEKQIGAL